MKRDPSIGSQGWRRHLGPLSLRSQIFLAFALLFAAILILTNLIRTFGIPFSSYQGAYGAMRDDVFHDLSLVADMKKQWLSLWLQERSYDAKLFARLLEPSLRNLYGIKGPSREPQRAGQDLTGDQHTKEILQDVNLRLNAITSVHKGYEKIQIVDEHTGVILASTDKKEVGSKCFGPSVLHKPINKGQ